MSFTQLRASGAFVVSADWKSGAVVPPVLVTSEKGAVLSLAKPWPKVCAHELSALGGAVAPVTEEGGRGIPDVDPLGRVSIPTTAGKTYQLSKCSGIEHFHNVMSNGSNAQHALGGDGARIPTLKSDDDAAFVSFCEHGWSTTFVDEFDGPLNTTNWDAVEESSEDYEKCQAGFGKNASNENNRWWTTHCTRTGVPSGYHTMSKAKQVAVEDGKLVIRADAVRDGSSFASITTGGVTSKRSFGGSAAHGPTRICLNAMLPGGGGAKGTGQGFWPALWMMPDDSSCWACHGEIDLVEMINGAGSNVQSHYHYSTNATWCEENAKLGCTLPNKGSCVAGGCGPATRGVYGPSSQNPVFRVSICAARTLNPTGRSRVTLSLRFKSEFKRAAREPRQEERGLKSAQNDSRRPALEHCDLGVS